MAWGGLRCAALRASTDGPHSPGCGVHAGPPLYATANLRRSALRAPPHLLFSSSFRSVWFLPRLQQVRSIQTWVLAGAIAPCLHDCCTASHPHDHTIDRSHHSHPKPRHAGAAQLAVPYPPLRPVQECRATKTTTACEHVLKLVLVLPRSMQLP